MLHGQIIGITFIDRLPTARMLLYLNERPRHLTIAREQFADNSTLGSQVSGELM